MIILNIFGKNHAIKIDLDFIAIRFARYYWEIIDADLRHMPKRSDLDPKFDRVAILPIIKDEAKKYDVIPDLETFASSSMNEFRKNVISRAIRREVLPHILTDFDKMYKIIPRKNYIICDIELIGFMKNNMDFIRKHIELKIYQFLKKRNPDVNSIQTSINAPSPFYRYISYYNQSLFLINIENNILMDDYNKTVRNKVLVDGLMTHVWGINTTDDNMHTWKQIRPNDIILFSNNNRCFARGIINSTLQDKKIPTSLWGKSERNLLMFFDKIFIFQLDLKSSRIKLIDDAINEHYVIKQIPADRLNILLTAYAKLPRALDEISEHAVDLPDNVRVILEKSESIIRKGQNKFRNIVLKNYYHRCAVCGINNENLLEASHIIPVRHMDTAGSINNGICFCVLHHKMFDMGYLYFDSEYNLRLSNNVKSDILKKSCIIHKISEKSCNILPLKKYLSVHRKNFGF